MTYIALSIIGILAVIAVRQIWKQKVQIIFVLSALVLGLGLFLFVDLFFIESKDVMEKGTTLGTRIPWLEISLYFIMLVGMASKYFFDAIGKGNKIKFQKWQFLRPILVSPMVFGVIYGNAGEDIPIMLFLIFAFQNGFFWQTVLNKNSGA